MRYWALLGLVVATGWLHVNFLGAMRPLGIVPNLLLVVLLYVALVRSGSESLAFAAMGGLLVDFASGADFGLRMAFYSVIALFMIALVQSGINLDNVGILVLITLGGTLFYNLTILGTLNASELSPWWGDIVTRIGIEMAGNVVLLLVLRPVFVRWVRRPMAGGTLPDAGWRR